MLRKSTNHVKGEQDNVELGKLILEQRQVGWLRV